MVDIRQWWSRFLIMAFALSLVPSAFAAQKADVVFNEIAWAGSADSSTDEWIELYNRTSQPIDLSGWKIVDDDTTDYVIKSGTIPAGGYFLIEDHENAVASVQADAVIAMSLSNSGDSLTLYDAQKNVIDVVNSEGKAWFAGDSSKKATMEKVDPKLDSDAKSSWKTAQTGNGAKSSKSSSILGTPKGANSVSVHGPKPISVRLVTSPTTVSEGATISVGIEVDTVNKLYDYGFDLTYDKSVLEFVKATKGPFLNFFGQHTTSFQAGLLGNEKGRVIAAEARMTNPKTPISGKGRLVSADFKVIGKAGKSSTLKIDAAKSFLGGEKSDIAATFSPLTIAVAGSVLVDPVTNLKVDEFTSRYALNISWRGSQNADGYIIERKAFDGSFLQIDTASTTNTTDQDGVRNGGNIIPHIAYTYRVTAYKGTNKSKPVEVVGKETRGLKADITRDDRVDGRDLAKFARIFGYSASHPEFDSRADLNYDGTVNGSDLIDLGIDFAKVYRS